MFKRITYTALVLLAVALVLATTYQAMELVKARHHTREVVQKDLKAGKWRPYRGEVRPLTLTVDRFSKNRLDALLKVVDPRFYAHSGGTILDALSGQRSLPQQLVQTLYFEHYNFGYDRIRQSIITTFAVEGNISKFNQLTLFINAVPLGLEKGKPVYGLEEGARAYYGKGFTSLSDAEYVQLLRRVESIQS
ncbi:MAG: transglycosylase domain-containing protein [Magnetococcales bacterium]|nr:transglycosylase domain-containing protein [Magnetococcales bacterium]